MERNVVFYRLAFFALSCLATLSYELSLPGNAGFSAIALGFVKGSAIFGLMLALEAHVRGMTLRSFNTTIVGIVFGSLMGFVITSSVHTLCSLTGITILPEVLNFIMLFVYLSALYIGIKASHTASEVWWMNIPFVKLSPSSQLKKKELILDISAIEDTRLTDLARSGILDDQLVLPLFLLKEIQKNMETAEEPTKTRYRKCYEQVKRLESLPALGLQVKEFHASDLDDMWTKLLKVAKLTDAYVIVSEAPTIKQDEEEGVTFVSIEGIANSIKPTAQRGETLTIKIQRPGKEPKQGVGYLEDGTMVVVNGGGDFLGETIKTQVLSQKYSSSGKIIFCNAAASDERRSSDEHHTAAGPSPYYAPQSATEGLIRLKRESTHDSWNRH